MIYKNFKEYISFNINNFDKINFFSQNCKDAVLGSTYLGIFWIILRPILTLASISFLFIFVLKINYNEIPFILFISGSLMVWNLFDEMLFWSTRALTSNKAYIKNFKSPNLIIIISGNFLGLIILSVYIIYFLSILIYYLVNNYLIFDFNFLGILLSLILVFTFSFSISIFTNFIDLKYRDIRFTIKYSLNFIMYISAVLFPIDKIPEKFISMILFLNPLAPWIINFRNSLFKKKEIIDSFFYYYSFSIIILVLILSIFFIYKKDKIIADII